MRVPDAEVEGRLARLRKEMRRRRLGGVYATDRNDVHYLSGFTGDDSAVFVTPSTRWLLTDSRFTEEAARSASLFETERWRGGLHRHAGALAKRLGLRRLGFDPATLSVADHRSLARGARGVTLREADGLVAALRAEKTPWEVKRIRRALRCAEKAFEGFRHGLREGVTETEARLDLEWAMRRGGASEAAFETIVAARANAALPHAHAGRRRLREGGPWLVDFGAVVDRYCSDLTRVLFLGSMPRFWRERYACLLDAQEAGIRALAPGASCADADGAARRVLAEGGWEEAFSHGLGHGVGLAVHEAPRLSARSAEVLRPGMVVTVEPGVYFPRRGGLRVEDMVLITETGRQRLSTLPRSAAWAVLS